MLEFQIHFNTYLSLLKMTVFNVVTSGYLLFLYFSWWYSCVQTIFNLVNEGKEKRKKIMLPYVLVSEPEFDRPDKLGMARHPQKASLR